MHIYVLKRFTLTIVDILPMPYLYPAIVETMDGEIGDLQLRGALTAAHPLPTSAPKGAANKVGASDRSLELQAELLVLKRQLAAKDKALESVLR